MILLKGSRSKEAKIISFKNVSQKVTHFSRINSVIFNKLISLIICLRWLEELLVQCDVVCLEFRHDFEEINFYINH